MNNGILILLMAAIFLGLGYLGVPVAFAIMAGVLIVTFFTPVSFSSIIGQLFHGIDSEALLAVPFFLLVGELMTSANVTYRMIMLAQTLVGHFRAGLAQVDVLEQVGERPAIRTGDRRCAPRESTAGVGPAQPTTSRASAR